MVLSHGRKGAVVWSRSTDQLARHYVHNEASRRLGGGAAVDRIDDLKTGLARGGGAGGRIDEQDRVSARTRGFHADACEVRCPEQKAETERRVGDWERLKGQGRGLDGRDGLQAWTEATLTARAAKRICPAAGRSVAASREAERPLLRPPPAPLPEPFDPVKTAPVHKGCSAHCEGRSSSVPFTHGGREVEVRGCSACVRVVDPLTAAVPVS